MPTRPKTVDPDDEPLLNVLRRKDSEDYDEISSVNQPGFYLNFIDVYRNNFSEPCWKRLKQAKYRWPLS